MLIVGMLGALATGRFGADIVLMGVLVTLLLTGILDAKEAISGFANPGVVTVAMLYVVAAGLRHLPGLFLSRIERRDETIIAVGPEQTLRAGDTLVFVGLMESVKDLQKFRGLTPSGVKKDAGRAPQLNRMIEVVISPASPLVGLSIREGQFRGRYGAVVIAVHRFGERVKGKIGDVVVRPGDTMLLEAPSGWSRSHRDSKDFYVVSEHSEAAAPRHERAWVSIGILALIVLGLSFAGWLGMSEMAVAMAGAAAMIAMRCCTGPQARSSIDWQALIVIGAAFGLGKAMEKTGLATMLAELTLGSVSGAGPIAMMAALYALTLICTIFITNNAAAVLAFPIAASAAQQAGMSDLTPFAIVIALAASLEFATPLGYQTNLMVMGPGGYRFMDYVRFGGPLTVLCGVTAITVLALMM